MTDNSDGFDPGEPFNPAGPEPVLTDRAPVEPDADLKPLTLTELRAYLREGSDELADGNEKAGQPIRADLRLTDKEIDMIAPGLVKIINARPQVRQYFGPIDYVRMALGMLRYGGRIGFEHFTTPGDDTPETFTGLLDEGQSTTTGSTQ